jgi:hypothetical protein
MKPTDADIECVEMDLDNMIKRAEIDLSDLNFTASIVAKGNMLHDKLKLLISDTDCRIKELRAFRNNIMLYAATSDSPGRL